MANTENITPNSKLKFISIAWLAPVFMFSGYTIFQAYAAHIALKNPVPVNSFVFLYNDYTIMLLIFAGLISVAGIHLTKNIFYIAQLKQEKRP